MKNQTISDHKIKPRNENWLLAEGVDEGDWLTNKNILFHSIYIKLFIIELRVCKKESEQENLKKIVGSFF